jgi:hypothetical protein
MPLVIPDAGEIRLLQIMLGAGDLTLKLYTNDFSPTITSVIGDFTEMTGMGYTSKTLGSGGWTVTTVSNVGSASAASQVWTFTAGGPTTIYGYFVVDASNNLLWGERFGVSVTVQLGGDSLTIVPKLTLATA